MARRHNKEDYEKEVWERDEVRRDWDYEKSVVKITRRVLRQLKDQGYEYDESGALRKTN